MSKIASELYLKVLGIVRKIELRRTGSKDVKMKQGGNKGGRMVKLMGGYIKKIKKDRREEECKGRMKDGSLNGRKGGWGEGARRKDGRAVGV